jgi:hypothetical protein
MRLLIIACLFLSPSLILAQSVLVDSYDDNIPSSEAEMWRLEDFRGKLLKQPDAKAYIIAYVGREDPPGKANRYALRAKRWLVEWRGVDPARIVALDGGRRNEFIVELWIAPHDAPAPVPKPEVDVQTDRTDNLLYDEFDIGYDNFAIRAENEAVRLDGFAAALKKEPQSWACVIAYAQVGDDHVGVEWGVPGEALRLAREQKRYLTRQGLSRNRVTVIDGGYASPLVELWIMRPGARFEKGPLVFPNRLRATGPRQLEIDSRPFKIEECCRVCVRQSKKPRFK